MLYIFVFLHQTATCLSDHAFTWQLYIFVFLHQTATEFRKSSFDCLLYIFVFLHQTATSLSTKCAIKGCISLFSYIKPQPSGICHVPSECCISLFSYIKPQPSVPPLATGYVVYLCFPTSNRNCQCNTMWQHCVVYLCFPTSNRNARLLWP